MLRLLGHWFGTCVYKPKNGCTLRHNWDTFCDCECDGVDAFFVENIVPSLFPCWYLPLVSGTIELATHHRRKLDKHLICKQPCKDGNVFNRLRHSTSRRKYSVLRQSRDSQDIVFFVLRPKRRFPDTSSLSLFFAV